MLNKLEAFLRQHQMLRPGDHVICAVSGGADSVALLMAMYQLREKLGISLSAAHFNHHLRGAESHRDEAFVQALCEEYGIQLHLSGGEVKSGKKGLEAAAREARYSFLRSLSGTVATAHTADDNAETVLMHMVRGTGLRGLGGIAPVSDGLIRPMLMITRREVLDFLKKNQLAFVTDSSNETDQFFRNRLRHQVMPVLEQENPRIAENLSAMALRLRQDEKALSDLAAQTQISVAELREAPAALRKRALGMLLEDCGVPEPEAEHIALAEKLVFSQKPSASAVFSGGVIIRRNYDTLERLDNRAEFLPMILNCPSKAELPELGLRVTVSQAEDCSNTEHSFVVCPKGNLCIRPRKAGDTMRMAGGTKDVKKLFIDRKIPAADRNRIPVVADDEGVLGVYGIGVNLDRKATQLPAIRIEFENIKPSVS